MLVQFLTWCRVYLADHPIRPAWFVAPALLLVACATWSTLPDSDSQAATRHHGSHRHTRAAIASREGSQVLARTEDGWCRLVDLDGGTRVRKGRHAVPPSALGPGLEVEVRTARRPDGSWHAEELKVVEARPKAGHSSSPLGWLALGGALGGGAGWLAARRRPRPVPDGD